MHELGWVDNLLMKTRPFFDAYFAAVLKLVTQLEQKHFGSEFGLYLHYEMRLTLPKILEVASPEAFVLVLHSGDCHEVSLAKPLRQRFRWPHRS